VIFPVTAPDAGVQKKRAARRAAYIIYTRRSQK